MIGEMNCLVTINSHTIAQDVNGDIVVTPSNTWQKWANVTKNSNSLLFGQGAINYDESYRLQMWYEPSRPTLANYTIQYNGKTMKVDSVTVDDEGKRMLETITASTKN